MQSEKRSTIQRLDSSLDLFKDVKREPTRKSNTEFIEATADSIENADTNWFYDDIVNGKTRICRPSSNNGSDTMMEFLKDILKAKKRDKVLEMDWFD